MRGRAALDDDRAGAGRADDGLERAGPGRRRAAVGGLRERGARPADVAERAGLLRLGTAGRAARRLRPARRDRPRGGRACGRRRGGLDAAARAGCGARPRDAEPRRGRGVAGARRRGRVGGERARRPPARAGGRRGAAPPGSASGGRDRRRGGRGGLPSTAPASGSRRRAWPRYATRSARATSCSQRWRGRSSGARSWWRPCGRGWRRPRRASSTRPEGCSTRSGRGSWRPGWRGNGGH